MRRMPVVRMADSGTRSRHAGPLSSAPPASLCEAICFACPVPAGPHLTSAIVALGLAANSSAAAPTVTGVAMLVPLMRA